MEINLPTEFTPLEPQSVHIGETVAVFRHTFGRPIMGYGRILKVNWSEFYCQWTADVLMYGGKEIHQGVLSCDVERAKWPRSITKTLLKCVEGGFPNV